MKDVGYFSHDSNAQHDPKIIKMLAKHGWESYGLFWGIVEKLRNETDYILETDYDSIAYAMRTQCDLIKSIIEDFELFIVEDGFFHSKRLDQCMQLKEKKSEKARQSSLKRWKNNANAKQTDTERNASKRKESKIKENKENKLDRRTDKFKTEVFEFHSQYDELLLKEFFLYWSEPNKSNTKMKFELQQTWNLKRRLDRWASNDTKPSPSQNFQKNGTLDAEISNRNKNLVQQSKRFKRYMADASKSAASTKEIGEILRPAIEKLKPTIQEEEESGRQ